jgi:hypothetical protein
VGTRCGEFLQRFHKRSGIYIVEVGGKGVNQMRSTKIFRIWWQSVAAERSQC